MTDFRVEESFLQDLSRGGVFWVNMKTPFKIRISSLLSLFVAVGLISAIPSHSFAQSEPSKPAAKTEAADVANKRLERVEFLETTLSESAEFLRHKFPEVTLILAEPPASKAGEFKSIPITLSMKSATLPQILQAIGLATNGRVQVSEKENLTYVFSLAAPAQPEPAVPQSRVFSLARFLEGKHGEELDRSIRDIDQVVNMAMDMVEVDGGQARPVSLRFHPPTKVLIAVGTDRKLTMLSQLVAALNEGAGPADAGVVGKAPGLSGVPLSEGLPLAKPVPALPASGAAKSPSASKP